MKFKDIKQMRKYVVWTEMNLAHFKKWKKAPVIPLYLTVKKRKPINSSMFHLQYISQYNRTSFILNF